jgi:protein O-GlcNAc transferase
LSFRTIQFGAVLLVVATLTSASAGQQAPYDLALGWFRQREYGKVVSLLEADPGQQDPAALNLLSLAYLELKRLDESLAANQRAIQLASDNPNYPYNTGLILLAKGDSKGAEETLRKALSRFPSSARLHDGLGEVFYRRDAFSEAESCFREAIRIDPNYGPAHVSLAKVFYAIGDRKGLASVIQKSLALEPDNYFACYLYGVWLSEETERTPEAKSYLQKSLSLNPKFVDAYIRLADLEMRANQYEAASELYRQAIEVDRRNARLYYLLAAAYRKLGNRDQAEESLAHYRRLVQ